MYWFLAVFVSLLIFTFIKFRSAIYSYFTLVIRSYPLIGSLVGPECYPIVGCVLDFKWNSVDFSFQLEQYGRRFLIPGTLGMVGTWIGPVPVVFLIRAQHVKSASTLECLLESSTLITKPSQYDIITTWIGEGLLTSTQNKWYNRRKMITPTFHFSVLKGYQDVFVRQGEIFVDRLGKEADTGREFNLFPYIKRCALDVICETAMGTKMGTQTGGNTEYVDAVTRISDIIWSYSRFPWLWLKPIWYGCGMGFEFDRQVKLTNDFTRKVIQSRKQELEEEGILEEKFDSETLKRRKMAFLDMLLLMQKANELTDEDIREEVDTFMFEGHDTTASGIGFTIWFLGQYPEYQKVVHEEIDRVFGVSSRDPTVDDLRQLEYLERCIKDALRLMPSVPFFGRVLSHDLDVDGIVLPKDLSVILIPVATHRDPEYWEQPESFYPDHFLPEKVSTRHPYAFIPFSAGPRNCIGQKFALAEEKTILSWFFRRYAVESVEPFPGNRPVPEVILKPSIGFPVRISKRSSS